MTKILLIAEHDGSAINPSTARCVTCAAEIADAEIHVAVFADDGANLANEVASLVSVDKVIQVDHTANAYPVAAVLARESIDRWIPGHVGPAVVAGEFDLFRFAGWLHWHDNSGESLKGCLS